MAVAIVVQKRAAWEHKIAIIMTHSAFKRVMEEILDVPRGSLNDSDTRDTIATWSSLADVKIMTTITSEFGLEPDAELLEAQSVGDLLQILESRGVFAV